MNKHTKRPALTSSLSDKDFRGFYWEKKELIAFCSEMGVPTSGGKVDIADRIAHFLETGKIIAAEKKAKGPKDSLHPIKSDTPVVNYNNDAITREFFISVCGPKFKFNSYLREFAKKENDGSLNYGDLAEGYKRSLLTPKKEIDGQFEYNQFFRDFFAHEKNATKEECIAAWKKLRAAGGKADYEHYKKLS